MRGKMRQCKIYLSTLSISLKTSLLPRKVERSSLEEEGRELGGGFTATMTIFSYFGHKRSFYIHGG